MERAGVHQFIRENLTASYLLKSDIQKFSSTAEGRRRKNTDTDVFGKAVPEEAEYVFITNTWIISSRSLALAFFRAESRPFCGAGTTYVHGVKFVAVAAHPRPGDCRSAADTNIQVCGYL